MPSKKTDTKSGKFNTIAADLREAGYDPVQMGKDFTKLLKLFGKQEDNKAQIVGSLFWEVMGSLEKLIQAPEGRVASGDGSKIIGPLFDLLLSDKAGPSLPVNAPQMLIHLGVAADKRAVELGKISRESGWISHGIISHGVEIEALAVAMRRYAMKAQAQLLKKQPFGPKGTPARGI